MQRNKQVLHATVLGTQSGTASGHTVSLLAVIRTNVDSDWVGAAQGIMHISNHDSYDLHSRHVNEPFRQWVVHLQCIHQWLFTVVEVQH